MSAHEKQGLYIEVFLCAGNFTLDRGLFTTINKAKEMLGLAYELRVIYDLVSVISIIVI